MKKTTKAFSLLTIFTIFSISLTVAVQRLIFLIINKKNEFGYDETLKTFLWHDEPIVYKTCGNGRPILLLHNTMIGASHDEWEKNIDFLSNHYKVYAPDLPGFGKSQKPKNTYSAYTYACFINNFIEKIIGRPTNVIASSASADFALLAYALHEHNMRRIILISPTGVEMPFANNADTSIRKKLEMPILGTHLFLHASKKSSIKKMLEEQMFFGKENVTDELVNSYYQNAHIGLENARFSYASYVSHFINTDTLKILPKLKIPFIIVWGEENVSNPFRNMEEIERTHPDEEYVIFEYTRMLPHYENSVEFNKVAKEFLN